MRRRHWAMVAAGLTGLAAGVGAFTFGYARGASYLSTDPAVCANCHIMEEHFAAWTKSSHRAAAGCADCHMPHDLIGKYAAKASNGFWHSVAFTTGRFPDPLQIKPHNRAITEHACRECHADVTAMMGRDVEPDRAGPAGAAGRPVGGGRPQIHDGVVPGSDGSCIRCHTYVGHWVR